MNKQNYFFISGAVFAIVSIVHIFRVINQFPVVVGTWAVPMSGSWIGAIAAGILSYWSFTLMGKEKK